jgi:hypothetical protein
MPEKVKNLEIGDKLVNISSMETYEKVEDIKIVEGKVEIVTKEYYKNTDSLISDRTIEWTIQTIESHMKNMPVKIES